MFVDPRSRVEARKWQSVNTRRLPLVPRATSSTCATSARLSACIVWDATLFVTLLAYNRSLDEMTLLLRHLSLGSAHRVSHFSAEGRLTQSGIYCCLLRLLMRAKCIGLHPRRWTWRRRTRSSWANGYCSLYCKLDAEKIETRRPSHPSAHMSSC